MINSPIPKFNAWAPETKVMLYDVGIMPHPEQYCVVNKGTMASKLHDFILLQNIGLKDRFEKEIYDGHILEDKLKKHRYKVFRVAGGFAINTHQDDLNKEKVFFYQSTSDMQNASYIESNCEIIGDIYHNPELLKNDLDVVASEIIKKF